MSQKNRMRGQRKCLKKQGWHFCKFDEIYKPEDPGSTNPRHKKPMKTINNIRFNLLKPMKKRTLKSSWRNTQGKENEKRCDINRIIFLTYCKKNYQPGILCQVKKNSFNNEGMTDFCKHTKAERNHHQKTCTVRNVRAVLQAEGRWSTITDRNLKKSHKRRKNIRNGRYVAKYIFKNRYL